MIVELFDKEMRIFPWWKNFYFLHVSLHETVTVTIKKINKALKPYRAKFVQDDIIGSHLVFDNKQDYVMFVLRWS